MTPQVYSRSVGIVSELVQRLTRRTSSLFAAEPPRSQATWLTREVRRQDQRWETGAWPVHQYEHLGNFSIWYFDASGCVTSKKLHKSQTAASGSPQPVQSNLRELGQVNRGHILIIPFWVKRCQSYSDLLKITDRSFSYASPCLWNQLPLSLRKPHSGTSSSISCSPIPSSITPSSFDSPLCASVTPSLFHSRLKTYLFHKSYPP